jgi:hypothetical protein
MKDSELLRAIGEHIDKHGFSVRYTGTSCGCFINAMNQVAGEILTNEQLWSLLGPVVGSFYTADALECAGWTTGCTHDAYAACMIAADICEAEGR